MRGIIDLLIFVLVTFFCMVLYNLSYAKLNDYKLEKSFKNIIIMFISTIITVINFKFNPV